MRKADFERNAYYSYLTFGGGIFKNMIYLCKIHKELLYNEIYNLIKGWQKRCKL